MTQEPYLKSIKLILGYLTNLDKIKLGMILVTNVILALLDLVGVAALGVVTALAVQGAQSLPPGDRVERFLSFINLIEAPLMEQIAILSFSVLLIFILKTICSAILTKKTLSFLGYRSASVGVRLVSFLLHDRVDFVQSRPVQELTYAVNSGSSYTVLGVLGGLTKFFSDLILMIVLAIGLLLVDWKTALAVFIIFGLTGVLLTRVLHTQAKTFGSEFAALTVKSTESTMNSLKAIKEISIRGTSSYFGSQYSTIKFKLAKIEAQAAFQNMISKYVFEIVVVFSAFAISAILLFLNSPSRGAAIIAIFLASISRAAPAALRAQQTITQLHNYFGKIEPTLFLLRRYKNGEIEISPSSTKTSVNNFIPFIKASNIEFKYETGEFSIKQVSFLINQGDFVAVLGPSGGGKTTLIDLILGVHSLDAGALLISGLTSTSVVKQFPGFIAYVPQEITILPMSIRDNISLGYSRETTSDEDCWRSLEIAQLDNFVKSLPDSLDQVLGDNGYGLSGGQKQRLGIARAIYTKPKILILDEATNALDAETAVSLSRSLESMKGEMTLIVIAHNLSTVVNANRIFYLDQGTLIEASSFNDLRMKVPRFDLTSGLQIL